MVAALLANYGLAVARAADHSFIAWGPTDLFPLAHPWTLVILLAALASHRGRPIMAAVAAALALVGPVVIDVLRGTPVAASPLCCSGGPLHDPSTAMLELAAMLLMVIVPVLAVARRGTRVAPVFLAIGHLLVAIVATVGLYALSLAAPAGRLDSFTLAAALAAVTLGAALGAGGGPWWLAIMPALWWWGVMPLHTQHDAAVGILLLVGTLAVPAARRLERGWISTDPSGHGVDQTPLVSTTS